jgi:hypothetical protein
MLPSTEPKMPQAEVLIVVAVPSSTTGTYTAMNSLGRQLVGSYPLFQSPTTPGRTNISILFQESAALEHSVLEAADALVLILDGQLGLDPHSIALWTHAVDLSLPRHIGAVHVATGRADFDELIAVATRVLEPDLMVRYLPIDAEETDAIVGQYDLLTADIHDCSSGVPVIRHGDPEHVSLTADRRNDLFEELAHAGLTDGSLETHLQGMPVSIPALIEAWTDQHIVSITALDDQTGAHILQEWFVHLSSRWVPALNQAEDFKSIDLATARVGIGIGLGLARMWGQVLSNSHLEVVAEDAVVAIVPVAQTSGCLVAEGIVLNQTVRVSGSADLVSAPRF